MAPRRDGNGGSLGSTSTLTGGDVGSGGIGIDDTLDSTTTPLTPVGMGDLVQPTEVTVQKINASSAIVSKTGEALTSPYEQLKSKVGEVTCDNHMLHLLWFGLKFIRSKHH